MVFNALVQRLLFFDKHGWREGQNLAAGRVSTFCWICVSFVGYVKSTFRWICQIYLLLDLSNQPFVGFFKSTFRLICQINLLLDMSNQPFAGFGQINLLLDFSNEPFVRSIVCWICQINLLPDMPNQKDCLIAVFSWVGGRIFKYMMYTNHRRTVFWILVYL